MLHAEPAAPLTQRPQACPFLLKGGREAQPRFCRGPGLHAWKSADGLSRWVEVSVPSDAFSACNQANAGNENTAQRPPQVDDGSCLPLWGEPVENSV